jgi:hypothetical protein
MPIINGTVYYNEKRQVNFLFLLWGLFEFYYEFVYTTVDEVYTITNN